MSRKLMALLLVVAVGLAACSGSDEAVCADGAEEWARYQLFLGRSTPSGEVVDDSSWSAFLRDSVTPRFPDGLTVIDGYGQWRDAQGEVQGERSTVLVILVPPDEDAMTRIDEVSYEYEQTFMQESVLRVVDRACVSFT